MIAIELLKQYGAVEKKMQKGQMLFLEGDKAIYYYQIVRGSIKMNNYNDKGRETIQGIFKVGDSFGEPAIFGDFPFPANGEAVTDTQLICLEKNRFVELLKNNFDIHYQMLATLSKRLRYKAMLSKEIKGHEAEHRILTLLQYLKSEANVKELYKVNITRQTIADLTGLTVETVIRAIKLLKEKNQVQVIQRKLYL